MRVIILLLSLVLISGCGSFENRLTQIKTNISTGNFIVKVYSGGLEVKQWEIKNGYVSTEANSDGWIFNYNGKLVRVSGTVIIEQQ